MCECDALSPLAQSGNGISYITYGNLRQVLNAGCGRIGTDGFAISYPKEPCDTVTKGNCQDSRLVVLTVGVLAHILLTTPRTVRDIREQLHANIVGRRGAHEFRTRAGAIIRYAWLVH